MALLDLEIKRVKEETAYSTNKTQNEKGIRDYVDLHRKVHENIASSSMSNISEKSHSFL